MGAGPSAVTFGQWLTAADLPPGRVKRLSVSVTSFHFYHDPFVSELHLFRRNFKKLQTKFKKFRWISHVHFLNLTFNFLKLRLKRCRQSRREPLECYECNILYETNCTNDIC